MLRFAQIRSQKQPDTTSSCRLPKVALREFCLCQDSRRRSLDLSRGHHQCGGSRREDRRVVRGSNKGLYYLEWARRKNTAPWEKHRAKSYWCPHQEFAA